MKKLLLLILLPLSLSAQENQVVNQDLIDNLKAIENVYFKYLTFETRREAVNLMDQIMKQISMVSDIDREEQRMISDESFSILLKNVSGEISGSTQVRMIMAIGKNGYIRCAQLKMLVEEITFNTYKIQLIKEIYPNILDPVNLVSITSLISSFFKREELEAWLSER